jgi:hypothetical protein
MEFAIFSGCNLMNVCPFIFLLLMSHFRVPIANSFPYTQYLQMVIDTFFKVKCLISRNFAMVRDNQIQLYITWSDD